MPDPDHFDLLLSPGSRQDAVDREAAVPAHGPDDEAWAGLSHPIDEPGDEIPSDPQAMFERGRAILEERRRRIGLRDVLDSVHCLARKDLMGPVYEELRKVFWDHGREVELKNTIIKALARELAETTDRAKFWREVALRATARKGDLV